MQKNYKPILLAMVLGDGSVGKSTDSRVNKVTGDVKSYKRYQFSLVHSITQKGYLLWKKKILDDIFNRDHKVHEYESLCNFDGKIYGKCRIWDCHNYWKVIRKLLYQNGRKVFSINVLKHLTPLCLAIWYMDDGNLVKRKDGYFELYLNTFLSSEENKVIINYFRKFWRVEFRLHAQGKNGRYRIGVSNEGAKRFLEIVRPFVEQVDCMKYKLSDFKNPNSL